MAYSLTPFHVGIWFLFAHNGTQDQEKSCLPSHVSAKSSFNQSVRDDTLRILGAPDVVELGLNAYKELSTSSFELGPIKCLLALHRSDTQWSFQFVRSVIF